MIATDKFLFLHFHKSGGTFINHALLKFIPEAKRLGYHFPYEHLPKGYKHLPVVGVVRNPWDFYISFYYFQRNSQHPNYIYRTFSDNGRCDMTQTIKNMSQPSASHFELLKENALNQFTDKGVNLTKGCVDKLEAMSGGWYSRLFQRMYDGAEPHFMRMESLREDFLNVIALFNEQSSPEFEKYVRNSKKKNTSTHSHYTTYYNDELKDYVSKADEKLIQRFDYKFGSTE